METLLAFLVLVGFLIWFHELGHFLAAKFFGVRVEIFSIGFGPPVISKRVGDTVYQIAVIPLGGFVKLYGEEEKVNDPTAFSGKPPWQKIVIALAGPFFNIMLTVLLFTVVFIIGMEIPKHMREPAIVGYVEKDSWGYKAGVKKGDLILKVGEVEIKSWEDLRKAVIENTLQKKEKVILVVKREGKIITLTVSLPTIETGQENLGIQPYLPPVIGKVFEKLKGIGISPAYQIGLREGDRILKVNGKEVSNWYEVVKTIRSGGGRPVKLLIERDGRLIEKVVIPAKDPSTGQAVIGIGPYMEVIKESYSLPAAISLALQRTWELFYMTFKVLWGLATGAISLKTLGGPIAIAKFAGQAAESGFVPYLSSMAFISLQLGIFNLLPLPVLDGGLILLFLIELIRRKPLPDKFKEYWQKIGFALIISLMIFVIVNDILRLFGN